MSVVRALADELQELAFHVDPFYATSRGVPGHGDRVPDLSVEAEQAERAAVQDLQRRARDVEEADLSTADRTTLACLLAHCTARLAVLDVAAIEHTVFAAGGFGGLVQLTSMTLLASPQEAADHLVRTAAYALMLDQLAQRLQAGAARGRTPVGALVQVVLAQLDGYLASGGDDPLAAVAAPAGWDGSQAWSAELQQVVDEQVRPAVRRLREVLAALPTRPDEQCGLVHLPGGEQDYARLVLRHTTLELTAQQVHDIGLAAVADLQARMVALGRELGLDGYDEVLEALRASAREVDPERAMNAAREAVARAEAVAPQWFSPPAPPPCQVLPMSPHLSSAGMPPHYTPPTDAGRAGTYWFAPLPGGIGSGWDSEAVAYHEAVPGHHLQLSRLQQLRDRLPALQSQGHVTAHLEGWGLYTEVLAQEMGLYSGVQAELGALAMQMVRAARLVVDTGMHAFGWSRQQAIEVFGSLAPVSAVFVASEVNRYIAMPGQALAYLIGQQELLRLREHAQQALGDRFDIRGFHDVVLDHGVLPLPALGTAVRTWVTEQR